MFSTVTVSVLFLIGYCHSDEQQIPVKILDTNTSLLKEEFPTFDTTVPLISNITYITVGPASISTDRVIESDPVTTRSVDGDILVKNIEDNTLAAPTPVTKKSQDTKNVDDNAQAAPVNNGDNTVKHTTNQLAQATPINDNDKAIKHTTNQLQLAAPMAHINDRDKTIKHTNQLAPSHDEDIKHTTEEPLKMKLIEENKPTEKDVEGFRSHHYGSIHGKKVPDVEIVEKDLYEGDEHGFNASHNMEIRAQAANPISIGLERNKSDDGPFTLNIAVPKDIRNANIVIQIPINVNMKPVDSKSEIKVKVDEGKDSKNKKSDKTNDKGFVPMKLLDGTVKKWEPRLSDVEIAKIIKEKIKKSKEDAKLKKIQSHASIQFNDPNKRPDTLYFQIQ